MKNAIAFVLATGLVSGVAFAQASFEELDADADGYVSAEEALASPEVAERFAALDADADGQLSAEEFAAGV